MFDAVISLAPRNPDAYILKAEANIELGNYEDAWRDLETANPMTSGNTQLKDKLNALKDQILPPIIRKRG